MAQTMRFLINGVAAAIAHFLILWFNVRILEVSSVGFANLCAAIGGISASFFGSRYFVFRTVEVSIIQQAVKFGLLYTTIALLHGLMLYLWSDLAGLDYRLGFMLVLIVQVGLTYYGNAAVVFKR